MRISHLPAHVHVLIPHVHCYHATSSNLQNMTAENQHVLWGGAIPHPLFSQLTGCDLEHSLHVLSPNSPEAHHWCRVRQESRVLSRGDSDELFGSISDSSSSRESSVSDSPLRYSNRRPLDRNGTEYIPVRIYVVPPSETFTPAPTVTAQKQHVHTYAYTPHRAAPTSSLVQLRAEEPDIQWKNQYAPFFGESNDKGENRVGAGKKQWSVHPLVCAQTQYRDGQYACTAIAAAYAVYWLQGRDAGFDGATLLGMLLEDSRTVMQSGVNWYRQWRDTAPTENKGFASLAGLYESRSEASHHLHIAEEEAVGGCIHTQDMERAANLLGNRCDGAWVFVTSHGLTVCVIVSNGGFVVVDSHPRETNGLRPQEGGCGGSGLRGCVVVCENEGQFVEYMRVFYREDGEVRFECIPVYLKWAQE